MASAIKKSSSPQAARVLVVGATGNVGTSVVTALAEDSRAPRYSSREAIAELLDGMREGAGMSTPPLAPTTLGGRVHELRTGVGTRP